MKKTIFFLLASLIFLAGCQRNEVLKTHGIAYLEKREKLITVNKSNKNDIINVLGNPATQGLTNNNIWIYIERTKTRGKLTKLGKNVLLKNNILVIMDKKGDSLDGLKRDVNKWNLGVFVLIMNIVGVLVGYATAYSNQVEYVFDAKFHNETN